MDHILDYLEMTAEKTNWKTGIDDGCISMSWKELTVLAQRIGTSFSKRTQPGRPVAIIMEKSAITLAAMFGAVYAGCFYAMIDPSQPVGRIREILRVLSPEIVLIDKEPEALQEADLFDGKAVSLKDCLYEEADMNALDRIRRAAKADDVLYCLFTSGSTGTPKGIAVSHRAVIDFITHFTEIFGITAEERIGNQAPFDFDVSVKDIYSCVFTGATLVLIPRSLFATPPRLLDYLIGKRVSTLIWAVSALTLVSSLKGLQYRIPTDVKKVMFSGEVMPARQLRLWQEALPHAEFINLYGPTEITCNCTYYRIPGPVSDDEKIPIGKPFPGRKVFLAAEDGSVITENGMAGEICVAGESLSCGYCNAPEETGKRFCRGQDGQLFYKTGDLGFWGADSELYYVGRKDFQVKIMGRRVEPEEVEQVMVRTGGADRACCLPVGSPVQLAAFYCGTEDERTLRKRLREKLPAHMVPRKLIRVDDIPLNKNGKTDRARLRTMLEDTV